jgi:hypothetical protein
MEEKTNTQLSNTDEFIIYIHIKFAAPIEFRQFIESAANSIVEKFPFAKYRFTWGTIGERWFYHQLPKSTNTTLIAPSKFWIRNNDSSTFSKVMFAEFFAPKFVENLIERSKYPFFTSQLQERLLRAISAGDNSSRNDLDLMTLAELICVLGDEDKIKKPNLIIKFKQEKEESGIVELVARIHNIKLICMNLDSNNISK